GRERDAAEAALHDLLSARSQSRADFNEKLEEAQRVVEWAQANATLAFAEVMPAWQLVLPQTTGIRDDILRGSPLLLYAQVTRRRGGGATTRPGARSGAATTCSAPRLTPTCAP